MNEYFEGWYFKNQIENSTIAFIPGVSSNTAFIQVITNKNSYNVLYPLSEFNKSKNVRIGKNLFSRNGIRIDMRDKDINIYGYLAYFNITPIKYDIMGIFKYFPMECYHGIISMHHTIKGSINIEGKDIDFTDGIGYIETDKGKSFPKSYLWVQCNDFDKKCSIMTSIADIPFVRTSFRGCICIILYKGKEYRLATYLGVKIRKYSNKEVIIEQGKYRLEINLLKKDGQRLYAPKSGLMTRTIHESLSSKARFSFYIKGKLIFNMESNNVGFEFV